MRTITELSESPPVYSVTNDSGTARIRFYENVVKEQREDGSAFTATMWEMSCPWNPTLDRRIREHPSLWLAKIKSVTAKEESAARLEKLKLTATDDAICELAELVADLMDAVTEIAGMIA